MSDKPAKVTICPPAPQEVFFQEGQFDEKLGDGTDPIRYIRGSMSEQKGKLPPSYGRKVKKDRLKRAEKALEGHENKEEILKILRSE